MLAGGCGSSSSSSNKLFPNKLFVSNVNFVSAFGSENIMMFRIDCYVLIYAKLSVM